jgi:hypothetical protein
LQFYIITYVTLNVYRVTEIKKIRGVQYEEKECYIITYVTEAILSILRRNAVVHSRRFVIYYCVKINN